MANEEMLLNVYEPWSAHSVEFQREELLAEVDLKWLFAGQGRWVDPAKLHSDAVYAAHILKEAVRSSIRPLHDCGIDLQSHWLESQVPDDARRASIH